MDIGSYDAIQQVYNQNIRLLQYRLPRQIENGVTTIFDDELIKLTIVVSNQLVEKITITTTKSHSVEYQQTFAGFQFGFDEGPNEDKQHSEVIANGILAKYERANDGVLTAILTRTSGKAIE